MDKYFRIEYVMDYTGGVVRRPIWTYYEAMMFATKLVHLGIWDSARIVEFKNGDRQTGAINIDRSQPTFLFSARRRMRDYSASDAYKYMCAVPWFTASKRSMETDRMPLSLSNDANTGVYCVTEDPKVMGISTGNTHTSEEFGKGHIILNREGLDFLADTLGMNRLPQKCEMWLIFSHSAWTDEPPGEHHYRVAYPCGKVGSPHRNKSSAMQEANEYMEQVEL